MKILLVEDNELNRDMLSRRLIKRGFSVVTAVNGQEGIDKAINERPNLILMDLSFLLHYLHILIVLPNWIE